MATAARTSNAAEIRTFIRCCVNVFPWDPRPKHSSDVMVLRRLSQIVLFIAVLFYSVLSDDTGLLLGIRNFRKKKSLPVIFCEQWHDSSFGLARNRGSIQGVGKIFFSPQNCSDHRFSGPIILVLNGYRRRFPPRLKGLGRGTDHLTSI